MKGTTYSGIAYLPAHPDADLHGLIRVVIREAGRMDAIAKLDRAGLLTAGLWQRKIWQESQSHSEILATERHYGEILVCPIVEQYLDPGEYRPLAIGNRKPSARARTGLVPKEKP